MCVYDTLDTGKENPMGINLRCFENVEWDDVRIFKAYSSKLDPQYVVPE